MAGQVKNTARAPAAAAGKNIYKTLIQKIFFDRYTPGATVLPFERTDIEDAARALDVRLPKNIGDLVYSLRYRMRMPDAILATQSEGMEWIIEGRGRAKYAFKLARINRIGPNPDLATIKIPDATPEIVSAYALSDEQALLAKVRYNRLIDVFLGVAAYSLQNHLRTTVPNVGQIEVDEIYVGVDRQGRQYILPVGLNGESGGIGRRAGFRFQWGNPWEFESPLSHQSDSQVSHRLCSRIEDR